MMPQPIAMIVKPVSLTVICHETRAVQHRYVRGRRRAPTAKTRCIMLLRM